MNKRRFDEFEAPAKPIMAQQRGSRSRRLRAEMRGNNLKDAADLEEGIPDGNIMISSNAHVNGVATKALLLHSGEFVWGDRRQSRQSVPTRDILGATRQEDARVLTLHTYPLEESTNCCGIARCRRQRTDVRLQLASSSEWKEWAMALDLLVRRGRPRRLTVLVNPVSGNGRAKRIFLKEVQPIFALSGIDLDVIYTTHRLHGTQVAQSLDTKTTDGIVCVGGDGVLVEVLNGLLLRADWEEAIRIPLGVIPAGSGNGVAKSVLHANGEPCDPLHAAVCIARGATQALDVYTVSQGDKRFHGVLGMTWALIADIDIESERFRFLGELRFTLQSIPRLLNLRRYNGSVHFISEKDMPPFSAQSPDAPPLSQEGIGLAVDPSSRPSSAFGRSSTPTPPCSAAERENASLLLGGLEEIAINDGQPVKGAERGVGVGGGSSRQGMPPVVLPPPESDKWTKVEAPFTVFWLKNLPWDTESAMAAPKAQLADGCLDLILVGDTSRPKMIQMALGIDAGTHINHDIVHYHKVRAVRLLPGTIVGQSTRGRIVVDGEQIAGTDVAVKSTTTSVSSGHAFPFQYAPVDICVRQGLATIFR
eukprot:jgi/Mesvir1/11283/Mv01077-RA.1